MWAVIKSIWIHFCIFWELQEVNFTHLDEVDGWMVSVSSPSRGIPDDDRGLIPDAL